MVNVLDQVFQQFHDAMLGTWGTSLGGYMHDSLMGLAVLQVGLIMVACMMESDLMSWLIAACLGIFRICLVILIFNHAQDWGESIMAEFIAIGSAFGTSPLIQTPGRVFLEGWNIAQLIFNTAASGSWFHEIFQEIEFFIIGCVVTLAWAFAGIVYLGALLEINAIIYGAPVLLCLAPLGITFEILFKWIRMFLGLCVKILVILLVLTTGLFLVNEWILTISSTSGTFTTNIGNLLVIPIMSGVFAWAVYYLPTHLSGIAFGHSMYGLGQQAMAAVGSWVGGSFGEVAMAGAQGIGNAADSAIGAAERAIDSGVESAAQKIQALLTQP